MPKLGITLAAYDAQDWLGSTLDSLLAQDDFTDWMCVIVDDGSTDDTARIAADYTARDARITLVRQPNGGLSAARNAGLAALPADLPYVAFIDADDLYVEGGLAQLVAALEERPDAVGAFGLAEMIDETGAPLAPGAHPSRQRDRRSLRRYGFKPVALDADSTFDDVGVYGPVWPPLVAVLRLPAVRSISGFDVGIALREDWDFYIRLTRTGPLAVVDDVVALYRRHSGNLSNARLAGALQEEAVRRKSYLSHENSVGQRIMVRRVWRRLGVAVCYSTLRRLLRAARARQLRSLPTMFASLIWTAATLAAPGPPRPSRRRLVWSGMASAPWDPTERSPT